MPFVSDHGGGATGELASAESLAPIGPRGPASPTSTHQQPERGAGAGFVEQSPCATDNTNRTVGHSCSLLVVYVVDTSAQKETPLAPAIKLYAIWNIEFVEPVFDGD